MKVFHYKFFAVEEGKNLDLKDMGTLVSKDTNELLWASNGVMIHSNQSSRTTRLSTT